MTLAGFIAALQRIDLTGAPRPGEHTFGRGGPLAPRDADTRENIATLDGMIDGRAATSVWEAALEAAEWDGPPVWIHGDLIGTNLLTHRGRLSAVIDFGGLGVGDPAYDLMPAWTLFSARSAPRCRSTTPPGYEVAGGRSAGH